MNTYDIVDEEISKALDAAFGAISRRVDLEDPYGSEEVLDAVYEQLGSPAMDAWAEFWRSKYTAVRLMESGL